MNEPMRLVILLDGKPGHETQSRGLVRHFKKAFDCRVNEVSCVLRQKAVRRLLYASLINFGLGSIASRFILKGYGIQPPTGKADFVISAGGDTVFANLALAKTLDAKSVFIGSPRKITLDSFGWLLTLEDYQVANNIVMPLAPVDIDDDAMTTQGRMLRQDRSLGQVKLMAVLIGGSGAGYQYTERDWLVLGEVLNKICQQQECNLLLTTSRRTGVEAEAVLKKTINAETIADAVWFSDKPKKTIGAYLGAADAVMVTSDSMSMVTEAVYSKKPVYVINPSHSMPEDKYAAALAKLDAQGLITCAAIKDMNSVKNHAAKAESSIDITKFWYETVSNIAKR